MILISLIIISFYFKQINCQIKEYRRLTTHYKCLNDFYPGTNEKIARVNIADQEIRWTSKPFHPPYDPPSYTAKVVLDGPDWADPEMNAVWFNAKPQWNLNNGQTYNRQCVNHIYLVNGSFPLNPIGRTGLKGRGLLGRWGPNHAVHAIVARYRRDDDQLVICDPKTDKPEIEVLVVRRADANLWSIPGRFLRGRERVNLAMKKCVIEECFNSLKSYTDPMRKKILSKITKLFNLGGPLIYLGYVDDPRNTDNAWVSTTGILFFDEAHNLTNGMHFQPGINILEAKWIPATEVAKMEFYGNHEHFIKDAVSELNAFYPVTASDELKPTEKSYSEGNKTDSFSS